LRVWIAALPDRQREVLFLRYYADLDYRTVADVLGIAVGTVSATLSRTSSPEKATRGGATVIDVDEMLRAELDRLVDIDPRRDWKEVETRAGLKRERMRGRWALVAAGAAVAVLLGAATPLGSAVVRGLDDFSTWLSGEPGSPVSEEEQREFDVANARSWLGFPQGTELRRLITQKVDGATVDLLGFRSGSSTLCLRLTVTGQSGTSTQSCAPLADLRRENGPARVLLADHTIGKGGQTAWYGTDRFHSPNLQVMAGIVTDGVTDVVLEDDAGRHEVKTASNAFLYQDGRRLQGGRAGSKRCAAARAACLFWQRLS
jgi:hypothetical protein